MSLQKWQETLVTAQVDGTAHTSADTASLIPAAAKYTLYAGFFEIGRSIRVTAYGVVTCDAADPGILQLKLMIGESIVLDGGAVPLNVSADKTNVGWRYEALITCRSIGLTATAMAAGILTSEAVVGSPAPSAGGSGTILLPYNTAPTVGETFDSTIANTIDLRHTQTKASGTPSPSITLNQIVVEALN